MIRLVWTFLLLSAAAPASAGQVDAPPIAPEGPTGQGGAQTVVTPALPNGGLDLGRTAVGTVDTSISGATRLPDQQGPTAQSTARGASPTAAATTNGTQAAPNGSASAAQGAAAAGRTANAQTETEGASVARPASARVGAPKTNAASAKASPNNALSSAVEEIRKAQKQDAASPEGVSAADAVRKLFDLEKSRSGQVAAPPPDAASPAQSVGPSGGGVPAKAQALQDRIAQKAALAQDPTTSPHDAPGLYKDAIQTAQDASAQGLMAAQTAQAVTQAVIGYAARAAETALTSIANSAYQAASRGDDQGRREVARALGTPAAKGSLDQWDELLSSPGKPLIANKESLKRDIARVLAEASSAMTVARPSTPKISFVPVGVLSFKAQLPQASVAGIPAGFLESLAVPGALKSPALFRASRPFEPGFSVFDGYRALRAQGVAFWPAARYAVRTEARSLWELVSPSPAPRVFDDGAQPLAVKADADYAAGDAKALADDYGDRDAIAAVAAAEKADVPAAKRYWLERLRDLTERRRPVKPAGSFKAAASAAELAAFASYVSSHRAEAASALGSVQADADALGSLAPIGAVRDLWVERGVIGRGASRRQVLVGFDARTREPLAAQIVPH